MVEARIEQRQKDIFVLRWHYDAACAFRTQRMLNRFNTYLGFWCCLIGESNRLAHSTRNRFWMSENSTEHSQNRLCRQFRCRVPMLTFFQITFLLSFCSFACAIHHAWYLLVDLRSDSWKANYCVFFQYCRILFFELVTARVGLVN